MGEKWTKICCSKEVFDKIMSECKEEFLKHHPEFKGINITQNFMLTKIAEFYLKN